MTPDHFLVFADPLPEPMLLVSGDGLILAGNRAVEERLGIALGVLRGRDIAAVVADSPGEVGEYLRTCSRIRGLVLGSLVMLVPGRDSIICRAEGTVLRPRMGGNEALLLLRLIPKASAVGQFVALNQRIADLDKENQRRRKAEEASRQQEERLRVTLSSIGDGVIVTDSQGRVTSLNARATALTGWTQDEALGCRLDEVFNIVNEEEGVTAENIALRVLKEGVILGLANHKLTAKDGTERFVEDSASPIRLEEANIGVVLVFRDITKRRKDEAELRESHRRKDEFLALLAHELRNPLAPIRNGLEIMRLAGSNRQAIDQARDMMERQVAHMVRLVDDLLDVSRISQDKIALRKERLDLAGVIRPTLKAYELAIKENGLDLTVTLPDKPVFLDADPVRLTQVLSNLLGNAVKYTQKGGRIWLTAEQLENQAVLTVRDDGIGIPAAMLPKVFDMFTQVDRSLEKSQGGLGIGLTIVKKMVELHGGSIEARSNGYGLGSEFAVRLPVAASQRQTIEPAGRKSQQAEATSHHILVVDDNFDSADTLAMVLTLLGNEVHTVYGGLEGVEAATKFRPDVILLDIGMPRLNGYDACRRIRGQAWGNEVVLVALTGWGQDEDKRLSYEAGFDFHLVKPVDPAALEKLLLSMPAKKADSRASSSC